MPMRSSDEATFLAAYDATAFAKPSVTVDVVLIGIQAGSLRTLLVRRTEHPDRQGDPPRPPHDPSRQPLIVFCSFPAFAGNEMTLFRCR